MCHCILIVLWTALEEGIYSFNSLSPEIDIRICCKFRKCLLSEVKMLRFYTFSVCERELDVHNDSCRFMTYLGQIFSSFLHGCSLSFIILIARNISWFFTFSFVLRSQPFSLWFVSGSHLCLLLIHFSSLITFCSFSFLIAISSHSGCFL